MKILGTEKVMLKQGDQELFYIEVTRCDDDLVRFTKPQAIAAGIYNRGGIPHYQNHSIVFHNGYEDELFMKGNHCCAMDLSWIGR